MCQVSTPELLATLGFHATSLPIPSDFYCVKLFRTSTTKSIYLTHNKNKCIFIRKYVLGIQAIDLFPDFLCA